MNGPAEGIVPDAETADGRGLPPADWNSTARTYPAALLHEAFEERAASTPDAPALRFRDEALTYGALNAHANQLAHQLIDIGARPGTLVAVCMDRSLEMAVALYWTLKSGAAYVPIDPGYPPDRISFMLDDVHQERWIRLRFEDLVRDPAGQMEALCRGLGLAFDPAVLRPYDGLEDKMVDGVYAESAPMGDPGFLARGRIDPSVAAAGSSEPSQLGTPTLDLAAGLGYRPIADDAQARGNQRGSLSRQGTLRRSVRGRDDG